MNLKCNAIYSKTLFQHVIFNSLANEVGIKMEISYWGQQDNTNCYKKDLLLTPKNLCLKTKINYNQLLLVGGWV